MECRDEILSFYQNLRSIWLLFPTMFLLLAILFIIKFYARMNTFNQFNNSSQIHDFEDPENIVNC